MSEYYSTETLNKMSKENKSETLKKKLLNLNVNIFGNIFDEIYLIKYFHDS